MVFRCSFDRASFRWLIWKFSMSFHYVPSGAGAGGRRAALCKLLATRSSTHNAARLNFPRWNHEKSSRRACELASERTDGRIDFDRLILTVNFAAACGCGVAVARSNEIRFIIFNSCRCSLWVLWVPFCRLIRSWFQCVTFNLALFARFTSKSR